jgi:nucleotide sugar dehydrogenase
MRKWRIGTIGTGFVGTAVSTGFETVLGDSVEIREYDKFKDTESLESVVNNSDILFICVPTPMNFETGKCDTSIVELVVRQINEIAKGKWIVIKSTVPPGTTKKLSEQYPQQNFVFSPEFLTEKNFINDFLNQDRIILGYTNYSIDIECNNVVFYLFNAFSAAQKKPGMIYETDSSVAEMTKYMGNAFLATKLSFCNEMYQICKVSGIEYDKVSELTSLDKRIGSSHMSVPGPDGKFGWSLSCLPKDINSLMCFARQHGIDPIFLESVWVKNLLVREDHDWEKLSQVNGKYDKKG